MNRKHALFNRNAELRRLLDAEQTGLDKLRVTLRFYAEGSHGIEGRCGCLVAGSATELAIFDAEMAARVTAALRRVEAFVRDLIRLGQSDGSIPAGIDADASACAVLCVLQGLRVVGKTGRTRAEMMAAVNRALQLLA